MTKITLPIYYHDGKELILIGLNKYERMHHQPRNKMKQWFYKIVRVNLPKTKITGRYKVHFMLYYKNSQCDAPNIIAAAEKMALDALQKYKVIEQDNVTFYVGASWEVAGEDKKNPRIEVEIFSA